MAPFGLTHALAHETHALLTRLHLALRSLRQGPTVGAVDSRGRPLPPPRGPACGPRAPGPGAIILSVLLAVAALFLADFVAVRFAACGNVAVIMRALTWHDAPFFSASRFRWRSPREPLPTPEAARVRHVSMTPRVLHVCADACCVRRCAWLAASITPLFAGATVLPSKGVPLLPPSVRAAAAAASAGAPQPSQAAEGQGGGGGGGVSGSFPDGSLSSAGVQQQQSQGSDNGQALSVALSAGGAAVALPVSPVTAGSGGADAPAPAAPAAPGAWRR